LVLGVALAATSASTNARAEPTDQDSALALRLFDEGRAYLTAGKAAEACGKLEESWRLNPLPGTLLNLAVCNEQVGRMATAVMQFRQARALAERDHRYDRLALANQHLQAIEGKVSNLVIVVGPGADRPDLSVSRDGTGVGRIVWGSRIPTDPGEHVIEASAPGKQPWRTTVTVLPDGDVQTIAVQALEDAPQPPSPPPPQPPVTPPAPEPAAAALLEPRHAMSTRQTIARVFVASGVVGIGIGSYFGLLAIRRHAASTCTTRPCSLQSIATNGEAGTAADFATGAFAAGLAVFGVGVAMWLADSSERSDKAPVSLVPSMGPRSGGVTLAGTF
jgi:hypothetical protein